MSKFPVMQLANESACESVCVNQFKFNVEF